MEWLILTLNVFVGNLFYGVIRIIIEGLFIVIDRVKVKEKRYWEV